MKSLEERVNDALKSTEAEIERAKIDFTEELLEQMEVKGISRSELAESLGVKPSRVTALLRGSNNFTLETMVRICRAIGAKYTHYIQPRGAVTVSYGAVPSSLLTPTGITFGSGLIFDLPRTTDSSLLASSVSWAKETSPLLTSNVLTLPVVGYAELIESRKGNEIPKIDADLPIAA
jgi:plasmid maintenance system antidote protein VapI